MSDALCPVTVKGVTEDRFGYEYVVLEDETGRQLPIWIGKCEVVAIQLQLQEVAMPRPMTHDLLCNSVEQLGGRLTRLIIDDLWDNRYYAKICVVATEGGEEMQIDCRPSDGLATAVRAGLPILVREDVMEEGKVPDTLGDDLDEDRPQVE